MFRITSYNVCYTKLLRPDARHGGRAVGAAALGNLVLVVREDEVEAAAVDVEDLAQVFRRHGRALDVPAGSPLAESYNFV